MKKRFISIAMVALMILSLAGCKKDTTGEDNSLKYIQEQKVNPWS